MEETKKVKYTAKDTVFTLLFKDLENVKRLYANLHDDADRYSDEDFKIITIENAFINDIYNDLGFSVKDRLIILAEAQSTFNPNMGIRLLMYIAKSYHDYIEDKKLNIFGEKLVKLPNPEFILVYSGDKHLDVNEIRLSDCFEPDFPQNLELVIKVINKNNINGGILQEYLDFCELYNKNVRARKGSDEKLKGLKDTIHTCIDNGILKDFLEHHRKEVETMLMTVFPPEQALEFVLLDEYNKGVEEGEARGRLIGEELGEARGRTLGEEIGKARGLELGRKGAIFDIAKTMLKSKFDIASVMKATGLSEEEISAL